MSVQFTGEQFQLTWLDAANYTYKESHSLGKAILGFFKGRNVTSENYELFRVDHIDSRLTKKINISRKIYERNIKELKVNFTNIDQIKGRDADDPDADMEGYEALKPSRTNENEVHFDTFKLRKLQDPLFSMIKERIEENGLDVTRFDNKDSDEIFKDLESLNLFTNYEMENIRSYISDELDSSPYWK